jgi:hypothetical protein
MRTLRKGWDSAPRERFRKSKKKRKAKLTAIEVIVLILAWPGAIGFAPRRGKFYHFSKNGA